MNSRLQSIKDRLSIDRGPNTKKRKHDEIESSSQPATKKPYLLQDRPRIQPYRPEEANVHTWGRKSTEDGHGQPRKYSANRRLKTIRHNIELSKERAKVSVDPPVIPSNKSVSDVPSSSASVQTVSWSGFSSHVRNNIGTPRPSSLSERISKIKNSGGFNKVLNDQDQRRTSLNTVGGGWFKSVDVEETTNSGRDKMTNSSSVISRSLGMNMPSTRDFRGQNGSRINRCASDTLSLNNGSSKKNISTFNEHGVSSLNNDNVKSRLSSESTAYINSLPHSDRSDEAMDWSSCDEKEVVTNLQEMRKTAKIASIVPTTPFQEAVAKEAREIEVNKMLLKTVYIVVDTNIFLSHLEVVKRAMKLKINGTSIGIARPIVLVPWIVIQELDYIKDGRHEYKLKSKAQQAIRFINDCLCNKANLKGQSVRDAAQQDFASSNFDDGILHCCLQIRERRNRAILLSNDVNLRNKLINEDFEVYSHDKIFQKLDPYQLSCPKPDPTTEYSVAENEKVVEIQTRLSHMCTYIILKELKSAYGDLWNKMGSAKKILPWSLQDCLDLFEKYWIPVFQMKVSKQCLKHIEIVNKSLRTRNEMLSDPEKLLNFGLTLCVHLKAAYSCYFDTITECIDSIQKIYDGI